MKKLLYLLFLLPSLSYSAFKTDWIQNTSSSITINGTTYYWQAGTGSNGQVLATDGATTPTLTWTNGGGGTVTLSTMTAGATNFIFNQDVLQEGATFYVSSGTINEYFQIGSYGSRPSLRFDASNPFSNASLIINDGLTSPGMNMRWRDFSNNDQAIESVGSSAYAIALSSSFGLSPLSRFSIAKQTGFISFQDNEANQMFGIATSSSNIYRGKPLIFYDQDNSNYSGFRASATLSSDTLWTLPASDSNGCFKSDGNGNLTIASCGGGGGSGTTIEVQSEGVSAVNTSTVNFKTGLQAVDNSGVADVSLNPSSYIGNQSWSDGVADPTITVAYNVSVGTPPELLFSDNEIETLNNISLPALTPDKPLILSPSGIVTSGDIPGSGLGAGSTNYIQNTNTLQSGSTFYVSSGTVRGALTAAPSTTSRALTVIPSGNIGVSVGATQSATNAGAMFDVSGSTSLGVVVFNNQAQTVGSANSMMTMVSTNTGYTGYFMRILRNDSNSNGEIRIDSPVPNLEFVETDQVSPAGKFELGINSGVSYIATRNAADDSFERIAEFRSKLASNNGVIVKSTGSLFLEDSVGSTLGFKAPNTLGGSWTHTLWNTSDNTGKVLVQTTAAGTRDLNWSKTIGKAADDIIFSSNVILSGGHTTFYHQAPVVITTMNVRGQINSNVAYPLPPLVVASSGLVTNLNAKYLSGYPAGATGASIPVLSVGAEWTANQTIVGGAQLDISEPGYLTFSGQSDQPLIYFLGPNIGSQFALWNDYASQTEDNLSFFNIDAGVPIISFYPDRIQNYMETYFSKLASFSERVIYNSSTTSVSSDQNNFNIGLPTFARLNITTPLTITGIVAQPAGAIKYICNVGTNPVVLANENAGSTAANRIATGTGANFVLASSNTVTAIYDGTSTRWRLW